MKNIGRPVNIISIGVSGINQNLCKLLQLIKQESSENADLIVLPEMCLGYGIQKMDCEAIMKMREAALLKGVYIIFTIFRYGDRDENENENETYNTSVLIDRKGNIAGIYDKAFPFWGEGFSDPPCLPGKDAPVFETDFGKIGISICFDVNFPDVYKRLSELGAELVLFPSGYSAGISLQAHAINYNYYIVSSTLAPDCLAYDITGREIYYQKTPGGVNISRLTLDLDRSIYHFDYNIAKRDKLLKEHAVEIEQDVCLAREAWFTLRALKPGVSVKKLAADYGLEELAHYKKRMRNEIDKLRGFSLGNL
ncbi:MAG: carbon-nitrogen hydrolase family protein [Oscillospiraceae bacterium]|nr:carbon-nitrogen hydrolase family protein [Oscillospiraceae bacterium]